METDKNQRESYRPFRTLKSASPETLFARYLQKQGRRPSRNQISTWELDGGQPDSSMDRYVLVHGYLCSTFTEKVRAHATYYWRVLKLFFHRRQHHYEK